MLKEEICENFLKKLTLLTGKFIDETSKEERYEALIAVLMEEIKKYWKNTTDSHEKSNCKQVYYFSMEFLLGKMLEMNILNMGIKVEVEAAMESLNLKWNELTELEPEPGLGNGGLGRLAACFLDSLASLGYAGHGMGMRYTHGLFKQKIVDGYQVELPDNWLLHGNMWETRKPEKAVEVKFGGYLREYEENGRLVVLHEHYDSVLAVPYYMPIVGYENAIVNELCLWGAEVISKNLDFAFYDGEKYFKAMELNKKVKAISQVLYPDDTFEEGLILRLKQEYFLSCAGVTRIIKNFLQKETDLKFLAKKVAIHINDTHPTLVIPELMRQLLDEYNLTWEEAWLITVETVSFTNHTILAEALEQWSENMMEKYLPRIFQIIKEISRRFAMEVWQRHTDNWNLSERVAILSHGKVHMAKLAIVGSNKVNGVSALHTDILMKNTFKDFYELYPERFHNKTNGVTPRRWLLHANPQLTNLLEATIGESFKRDLSHLIKFMDFHEDVGVLDEIKLIKRNNKERLASLIKDQTGILIDTNSIFDVQIKRFHGYKRQLMNILQIIQLYQRILENPNMEMQARTYIFAGKAAPSYYYAKNIIHLINTVARKINSDPQVKNLLKVVFLENYNVSLAEKIIPSADISEQISTASKEASGTGNMKFMMNGAVTIGTMDGANVEINELVGGNNMVVFGLTSNQVLAYYQQGGYSSWDIYNHNNHIKRVVDSLTDGFLGYDGDYIDIKRSLLDYNDEFFVLGDLESYCAAQVRVDKLYQNQQLWQKSCLINIAKSGSFSSDRTVEQYAKEIWLLKK
ncbi:MAG: glycogen/starch/alpha-glucan phosphorylase [Clostridia bacterium]